MFINFIHYYSPRCIFNILCTQHYICKVWEL